MAVDLSGRGKPVHVDPKPYVPRFTNVEMLFMSLQTQISQLKAEVDEAMAMAANAAIMPRQGAAEADTVPASFDLKSATDSTITLHKGFIYQLGRPSIECGELTCNVSGTKDAPCRIILRWKPSDDTVELYDADSDPVSPDDGTWRYRVLWEAYLSGETNGVTISFDRRKDWIIGSPL